MNQSAETGPLLAKFSEQGWLSNVVVATTLLPVFCFVGYQMVVQGVGSKDLSESQFLVSAVLAMLLAASPMLYALYANLRYAKTGFVFVYQNGLYIKRNHYGNYGIGMYSLFPITRDTKELQSLLAKPGTTDKREQLIPWASIEQIHLKQVSNSLYLKVFLQSGNEKSLMTVKVAAKDKNAVLEKLRQLGVSVRSV